MVGPDCLDLKTITHASGGRCYCPKNMNDGLNLFEIETILSTKARGNIISKEPLKNI